MSDQGAEKASGEVQTSAGRVSVPGGELYYEVAGAGETIVLIHGNAGDLRHWDLQVDALSREHRVIRYDVRGFGRSSGPASGQPFSHYGDLALLLDHLGVAEAHILGWSFGSGIAIDFAIAFPERTISVISVGPWVNGYSSEASGQLASWLRAVSRAGSEEGSLAAVAAWTTDPAWVATVRDSVAGEMFRYIAAAQSFLPADGPISRESLHPPAVGRMADISVPMLIVTAEHDLPVDVEVADLLERTVPKAQRVTMADTGHLMHMERPDEFNSLVLGFLDSIGG